LSPENIEKMVAESRKVYDNWDKKSVRNDQGEKDLPERLPYRGTFVGGKPCSRSIFYEGVP
jgi:hypothetical protein